MRTSWIVFVPALAFLACGVFDSSDDATTETDAGADANDELITGTPPGSLEATVEGDVQVLVTGRIATIKLTVARKGYEGAVEISLKNIPPEIDAPKVTLEASKQVAELKVTAAKAMKQGDLPNVELALSSPNGATKGSKPLKVFVRGAPGDLDTTFATNGMLKTPNPATGYTKQNVLGAAADGSFWVLSDGALFRFTANGGAHPLLGPTGTVQLGANTLVPRAVVAGANDKVYLVRNEEGTGGVYIERRGPDGALDSSYASPTGSFTVDTFANGIGFALRSDGHSVVGSYATHLYWVSDVGAKDTAVNALARSDTITMTEGVLETNRLTGITGTKVFRVALPGGAFDGAFGGGSRVVDANVSLGDIIADSKGGFIVTGRHSISGTLYLARLLDDGSTDPAFTSGSGTFPVKSPTTQYCDVAPSCSISAAGPTGKLALQPDGKILQAAQVEVSGATRCTITRYLANGTVDPTFGEGGRATPAIDGCAAQNVQLQPDGRILVGATVIVRVWGGD